MPECPVGAIVVVVPACDEEASIARVLGGVRRAAATVSGTVDVEVVVVVNGTTDGTSRIVRAEGAHLLERPAGDVGAARAAGADWALRRFADRVDELWIATTDADSLVPASWLHEQVLAAGRGADVFLGTVTLTPEDTRRHHVWAAEYATQARRRHHGHVHGANLGLRARTYLAVGGFRSMTSHEDADLVARLRGHGAAIEWATHVPVLTSARHDPRARHGLGDDLVASL